MVLNRGTRAQVEAISETWVNFTLSGRAAAALRGEHTPRSGMAS
jgi:hypothetical protein